jgi:hypothetical protein
VRRAFVGEQARAGMAKAMLNRPRLLLLDEPTASLDPSVAREVREKIVALVRGTGTGVLWTSHNMHEVEQVCDRVLFLSHGRILLEGNPAHAAGRARPRHARGPVRGRGARAAQPRGGQAAVNAGRAFAIVLRQGYLMRGSPARVLPLFAWVAVDIVLWGFITKYLDQVAHAGSTSSPSLLGAVLLWDFFSRVMQA